MTRILMNMCIFKLSHQILGKGVIAAIFSGQILAAHAAWLPFKPRLYASIKRRERFANCLMDAKGMESKASHAQTLTIGTLFVC